MFRRHQEIDETNERLAERWTEAVTETYGVEAGSQRPGKLLVLVNPHAGTGHARHILYKAGPILEELGFAYDAVVTERPGHALEHITKAKDADEWTAVVVISGDGTVHEVVNGLHGRGMLDRVPIAVVPAGSGNALCRVIAHEQVKRD